MTSNSVGDDLEKYRQPWESDEHWELRKNFLICYKDSFPENKLLCLAQVYVNVELLGCRYIDEVMQRIKELADDLPVDSQHKKFKPESVAFVQASQSGRKDHEVPRKEKKLIPNQPSIGTDPSISMPSTSESTSCKPYGNVCNQSAAGTFSEELKSKIGEYKMSNRIPKKHLAIPVKYKDQLSRYENMLLHLKQEFHKGRKNWENQGISQLFGRCLEKFQVQHRYVFTDQPGKDKQAHLVVHACSLYFDQLLVVQAEGRCKKGCRKQVDNDVKQLLQDPKSRIVHENGNFVFSTSSVDSDGDNLQLPSTSSFAHNLDSGSAVSSKSIRSQLPFDFVILEGPGNGNSNDNRPNSMLNNSAGFNKVQLNYVYEAAKRGPGQTRCTIKMNGIPVGVGESPNKNISKDVAAQDAVATLRKHCYTIKMKCRLVADTEITRGSIVADGQTLDDKISDSNVGNKLLRLMGWSGGGLGKEGAGISEPIKAHDVYGRQGFGSAENRASKKGFTQRIFPIIRDYAASDSNNDLAFSSDFTSDERKEIHRLASKFHLKSCSRGKGKSRFLVLSRKFGPHELLIHIRENGGSTDKYELIPPTNMSD